jgi:hypothetical protein
VVGHRFDPGLWRTHGPRVGWPVGAPPVPVVVSGAFQGQHPGRPRLGGALSTLPLLIPTWSGGATSSPDSPSASATTAKSTGSRT